MILLFRKSRIRGARGFTLLEVIVAITVVNVLVCVIARQLVAHSQLVDELEEWCSDNPVYYIDPEVDPAARATELPANLRLVAPEARWVDQVEDKFAVRVTQVDRDLESLTSVASVTQINGF